MDIALHTLENVSAFIAVASLKGSVLIVLVLATQKLLGKLLPANWRYMLWFTAVFGLVTPVGYEATLPPEIRNPDFATFANVPLTESTRESAPEKPAGSAPPSPSPGRVPMVPDAGSETLVPAPLPVQNLTSLLSILWLAGVVAVIIAIAREGHRFAALVRRACPASAGAHAILRECSYLTGCRRSIALLESEEVGAPMISGQLTPTLLLPAGLPEVLTTAQLRHVFIHELMHLQRGDIAGNWIVAAVQALHWFNPLVWLAFSRMRLDRELACDAATLRYLAPAEAADYGRTLLQLNEAVPRARAPAIALGMVHGSSDLHRRIVMLGRPSSRSRHAAAGTLVMLSLAALAFGQPVTGPRGPVMAPEVYAPVAAERPGQITAFTDDESEAGAVTPAPQPVPVTAQAVIVEETISDTLNPPVPERVQPTPVSSAASTGAESRGSEAVEQRAPAGVENPAAWPSTPAIAPTTLLAAASTTSGTLTQAEPPPIAPYEGLVELERLADSLQAMKADKLAFIEKWNEISSKCAARKESFLGVFGAACQRIRTAQRRGEIFRFAYECYQLDAIHQDLVTDYRESAAPQRESQRAQEVLRNNARDVAAICSKDTYANQYPAFAEMFADAEALKYYPQRKASSVNPNRTAANFSDVFFHQDRAGGNTGLGTSGTGYSPSYPNLDTPVGGIFGSGIAPGTVNAIAPTPVQ